MNNPWEEQNYWFEQPIGSKTPIAIHWKGTAMVTLPVVFSAIWIATSIAYFIPSMHIDQSWPFFTFSLFSFVQGIKFFVYHEKTRK